jgi:N-acetylglucosaminyl-diphospho-decaprenol L-rhamnosyltransferase
VNYRTPEFTNRALAAAHAAATGLEVEELAVDSASGDGSADTLRRSRPSAEVIELDANRGYAAGLNAGIARSTGRTLLLLNSDAFAEGDAVTTLVRYLDDHPGVGLVAPRLSQADGSLQINAYRRFPNLVTLFADFCLPLHPLGATAFHPHQLPSSSFDRARRVSHVMGAAMLARREALDRTGPFDEGFFLYLEETEWQRRLHSAGWEIHIEPAARVMHAGQGSDEDAHVVSDHYIDSALRYYRSPAAARRVMLAGGWISLWSARAAMRLRPSDPRFAKLADSFGRVVRTLGATGAEPSP